MNKKSIVGLSSLFLVTLVCLVLWRGETSKKPLMGDWHCIALDARHLALTGDYALLERKLFDERLKKWSSSLRRLVFFWSKDERYRYPAIEVIAACRSSVVGMLRNAPSVHIESDNGEVSLTQTGYWLTPVGQSRFPDGNGQDHLVQCAEVAHYLFLTLSRPLSDGENIKLKLPAGETLSFSYSLNCPTPLFKINQVGYMPFARKYAYLGAWLGTAGPMPLHLEYDGKPFQLIDASNGRTVFTGTLKKRREDPRTANGVPFTGEEVLELDFSECKTPGTYYLEVSGLGRSDEFRINDNTMAESFFIHARGLFHQRCGIAKELPYTPWTMKRCHPFFYRGTFPPDHYGKSEDKLPYGFKDCNGKGIAVDHFKLIKQNIPASLERLDVCGGWHDAADWDRRPQHLRIVGDLVAIYLLKPNNFIAGQLNIPESGNGIPDILDEALWGIDYLRQIQQPDGGVGTWIETTRHPGYPEVSSEDKLVYYISCPTRNSTLEYAAYSAEIALALKMAGAQKQAELLHNSAALAWNYAMNERNAKVRSFHYDEQLISYRETPELAPEFVVKAAMDLFFFDNDKKYLVAAEDMVKKRSNSILRSAWSWSPFFWIELEVFPIESLEINKIRKTRCQAIVKEATKMLWLQEECYPIRVNWIEPTGGWVHTMSWGNSHPLRRARTFIAAHAITGDVKYLEAACLANDFNNGANPSGSSNIAVFLGSITSHRLSH